MNCTPPPIFLTLRNELGNCVLKEMPINKFKKNLLSGENQYGLWPSLADTYCAEICAGAGFDWLLIDAEHGPNDLRSILAQLQAIAPYMAQAVVRPPQGDTVLIKQLLETGIQTLLVPMVETAAQAQELVCAMRYPTQGVRGVGSAIARASRWGRYENYLECANQEVCLLVQVETVLGIKNLADIVDVDGVDGVFFGAADLAASMGYLGQSNNPEVVEVIASGLKYVKSQGKAGGILSGDKNLVDYYRAAGANFLALGVDSLLLAKASSELLAQYRLEGSSGVAPALY